MHIFITLAFANEEESPNLDEYELEERDSKELEQATVLDSEPEGREIMSLDRFVKLRMLKIQMERAGIRHSPQRVSKNPL